MARRAVLRALCGETLGNSLFRNAPNESAIGSTKASYVDLPAKRLSASGIPATTPGQVDWHESALLLKSSRAVCESVRGARPGSRSMRHVPDFCVRLFPSLPQRTRQGWVNPARLILLAVDGLDQTFNDLLS